MHIYQLGNITDKKAALKALGVESGGVGIMAHKMSCSTFSLKILKRLL